MNTQTFSIKKTVTESWDILKGNFWKILGSFVFYFILTFAINLLGQESAITSIVATLVRFYLTLVFIRYLIDTANGGKLSYFSFFKKTSGADYWRFFLNNLLVGLIVVVVVLVIGVPAFFVSIWFWLLFIPAMYIFLALTFATYFAADGVGPVQSVKQSWSVTKGVKIKLFVLGFVFLVIFIVSLIPAGIVALLTSPISVPVIILGFIGLALSMVFAAVIPAHLYVNFAKKRQISSSESSS